MYTLNWSLELGQYTNVYNIEFEQRIYLTIYLFIYLLTIDNIKYIRYTYTGFVHWTTDMM